MDAHSAVQRESAPQAVRTLDQLGQRAHGILAVPRFSVTSGCQLMSGRAVRKAEYRPSQAHRCSHPYASPGSSADLARFRAFFPSFFAFAAFAMSSMDRTISGSAFLKFF